MFIEVAVKFDVTWEMRTVQKLSVVRSSNITKWARGLVIFTVELALTVNVLLENDPVTFSTDARISATKFTDTFTKAALKEVKL